MLDFKKERRLQAKYERLGTQSPQCALCAEIDPRCLERHHLAGKAWDPDTLVILCRNCHRKASDDQRDHPKAQAENATVAEMIVHALHGIADLLGLLAEQCRKYAEQLLQTIGGKECFA